MIHDFMSFSDETFDFENVSGLVLIRGKNNDIPNETNGAGKSNIGNSLQYALFGQLQTKIKNENVINRKSSDRNMRLILDFSVDSDDYRIVRGIQKGRNSYLNLFMLSETAETDITKSTITETQKFIESELLHCDMSIFLRTIMLTADQTYNFYMLKKQDKKDFVEKLFDIGVFGCMYEKIHKDLLTFDKQALAKQNQMMVLNQNAVDYTARSAVFEKNHQEKLTTLAMNVKTLENAYNELNKKEVVVNTDVVQKLQDALVKLQESELKCKKESVDISGNIQRNKMTIDSIDQQIASRNSVINKHSELLSKLCTECADVFQAYYNLDSYQAEIDKLSEKKIELNNQTKIILEAQHKNAEKQKKYLNKIELAKSHILSLTSEHTKLQSDMAKASTALNSAKMELASEESAKDPYLELMSKNNDQIKIANAEIEQLAKKIAYLKAAESIVSQDTLRKFIIKDLIGILNNKIRKYLIRLGANYYVRFDDDMDYEFIPTVGTCEFGNFSAGEKMRLMIATSFAFRDFMSIRNGLCSNILILDEYFDGAISSACIENLMSILKDYRHDFNQNIFIISQRQEVQLDNFNKIVQVEKTNDISKITYI